MTQITKITGYFGNYIHKSSAQRALRQAIGSEREALFPPPVLT